MPKKNQPTDQDQELALEALRILSQNQWKAPNFPKYVPPDNGMKCTCEGTQPDPDCPLHRVIG